MKSAILHYAAPALLPLLLLTGCAKSVDTTPVWEETLDETGVRVTLANCTILDNGPMSYSHDRGTATHNLGAWPQIDGVKVDGTPLVTFYGVTAQDIQLRFLENIAELYLDYDAVYPQIDLDYVATEGDGFVSYRLDTAYNFDFTVTTEQGTDSILVAARRSDIQKETGESE